MDYAARAHSLARRAKWDWGRAIWRRGRNLVVARPGVRTARTPPWGLHWRAALAPGLTAFALALAAAPACAGPPYVTDDPEPTDLGHWEVYNFIAVVGAAGGSSGQGGVDANYGAAKDLQLTVVAPLDFQSGLETGPGDLQLAAKYRILHQSDGPLGVDLSLFPRVFAPTAPARFGPRTASLFLPVWMEKDFGPWSVFGGGGYQINPGRDNRNFWQSGLAVARAFGETASLGAEVYHQTPNTAEGRAFTGLNFGATLKASPHWSILLSAGPGVQNAREGGEYDAYFALEATY